MLVFQVQNLSKNDQAVIQFLDAEGSRTLASPSTHSTTVEPSETFVTPS
jgi:hypothetical protein